MVVGLRIVLTVLLLMTAVRVNAESFYEHQLAVLSAKQKFPEYYASALSKNFQIAIDTFTEAAKCFGGKYYWENNHFSVVLDISTEGEVSNLRIVPETPEAECLAAILFTQKYPPAPAYPGRKGFPFGFGHTINPPHSSADSLPPAQDKIENDSIKPFFGSCRFLTKNKDEFILTGAGLTWRDCMNQPYRVLNHREGLLVLQMDEVRKCMVNLGMSIVEVEIEGADKFRISFYASDDLYRKDKPALRGSCKRFPIVKRQIVQ